MRNSSMGPTNGINLMTHHTMSSLPLSYISDIADLWPAKPDVVHWMEQEIMGPPWGIDPMSHHTMSILSLSYISDIIDLCKYFIGQYVLLIWPVKLHVVHWDGTKNNGFTMRVWSNDPPWVFYNWATSQIIDLSKYFVGQYILLVRPVKHLIWCTGWYEK